MIGGMVTHTGGAALAKHLLRTDENERVAIRIHGLCATDLHRAIAELRLMGRDARTQKPLVHAWASPSITYDEDEWDDYWDRFEQEFDLVGQPYIEAQHTKLSKGGRIVGHRHRVYLRISPNGGVLPMRHTVPRMEKLSRIAEFMTGEPFVSGVYNKSVIAHLSQEGYSAIADAMIAQGLGDHRAGSTCSSAERAASDRTQDIPADEVKRRIFSVLSSGAQGGDLVVALAESGLHLAQGEKAIVVVTPVGNVIPLLRGYNQIARQRGGDTMKKAELAARLVGAELPALTDVTAALQPHNIDWITHVGAKRRENRDAGPKDLDASLADDFLVLADAEIVQCAPETGLPAAPDRFSAPQDAVLAPAVEPINPSTMTPAQKAALDAWLEAMFAPAPVRQQLQPDRQDDEPAAENHRLRQKRERIDRNKLAAEERHLTRAALEHPDWRSQHKAKLAGIPPNLGSRIAWVDSLEKNRKRIRLRYSDTIITTEPGRISSSTDTLETTSIIAEIAAGKGWKEATITGGSREWREALAREATRAGIMIVNPDLAHIVADEKQEMEIRKHLAAWRDARTRLERSRSQEDALSFASVLENMPPGILDHVENQQTRRRLAADLDVLARRRERLEHEASATEIDVISPAPGRGPP